MLQFEQSPPQTPARVVVLGATGFVGRAVCAQLEGTTELVPLGSKDCDLTVPAAVDVLEGILRDDDAVVFISALTPDRGKDIATLMRNLSMAQHVCAAVAKRRLSHLVYVSSDAVYEDRASLVNEQTPCAPQSFHGVMHLVRERMLIQTLAAAKVPLAILRPSLLYGATDTHNGYGPNRFFRTALKDRKITLFGGGEEQRDHVAIDDVASLIVASLRQRATGTLNIASGTAHSFAEVADAIRQRVPDPVAVEQLPRGSEITHRHFDITATVQAFPAFRPTPLAAGLDAMGQSLGARV